MHVAEYSRRYGYARSSVARWVKRGLIDGAARIDDKWDIPEGARPRYVVRKGSGRTQADNAYDVLRALLQRKFVDSRVLRCSDADFKDVIASLVSAGLIRSSIEAADGRWYTGYSLTQNGMDRSQEGKAGFRKFYRETVAAVTEGAVAAHLA